MFHGSTFGITLYDNNGRPSVAIIARRVGCPPSRPDPLYEIVIHSATEFPNSEHTQRNCKYLHGQFCHSVILTISECEQLERCQTFEEQMDVLGRLLQERWEPLTNPEVTAEAGLHYM